MTNQQATELTKYVRTVLGDVVRVPMAKADFDDAVQDILVLVLQQAKDGEPWEHTLALAAKKVRWYCHRHVFGYEPNEGIYNRPQHVRIEDVSEVELGYGHEEKELPEAILSAMDGLDKGELELLRMAHGLDGYEELTHEEIAAKLGRERSVITKRLQRIHAKLAAAAKVAGL